MIGGFLDNNPTFTYVKVKGLTIIYNNYSYVIQDIYTSCDYLYWDTSTPNVLIETDIRLDESSNVYLICMNKNGIHTQIPHEGLTYDFSGLNRNGGEVSKSEFTSLRTEVENNKTKYVTLSQTVDGINEIIGDESTLEDGTIIQNINVVKRTSTELSAKVEKIETSYADEFSEVRDEISDALVSLLISMGTFHSDFNSCASSLDIVDSDKTQLEDELSTISEDLTKTETIINELITLLNDNSQTNYATNVANSLKDAKTTVSELVSFAGTAISDGAISSSEITIVVQAIGKASEKVNVLKATCDEVILLGLGGTIYDQFSKLQMLNNRIQTTVKEIKYSTTNSLSRERSRAYAQVEDLNTAVDSFYNLINSLSTTSNLSSVEIGAINSTLETITREYNDLMVLTVAYETSELLSTSEKSEFIAKGNVLTGRYNTLVNSVNSMLTDSYMNSSEQATILNNSKKLLDSIEVYREDTSQVILLIESYKFTQKINEAKDELNESIKELNDSMKDLSNFTNQTFINNFVDKNELNELIKSLNKLKREKQDVTNIYNSIKSLSTDNADFTTAYNKLITEYDLVISVMSKYKMNSAIPSDADKSKIETGYKNLAKRINTFVTKGYELNKQGIKELNDATYNEYTTAKDTLITTLNTFSENANALFDTHRLTTSEKEQFNHLFSASYVAIEGYTQNTIDYIRNSSASETMTDDVRGVYNKCCELLNSSFYEWKDACNYIVEKNFVIGENEINAILTERSELELSLAKLNTISTVLCSRIIKDFDTVFMDLVNMYNNLYAINSETGIISDEIDSTLVGEVLNKTLLVDNYTNFLSGHITDSELATIHTSYVDKQAEIALLINNIVNNLGGDLDSYYVLLTEMIDIMQSYVLFIVNYVDNSTMTTSELNAWSDELVDYHTADDSMYEGVNFLKALRVGIETSLNYITTNNATILSEVGVSTNPIVWLQSKKLTSVAITSLGITNLKTSYQSFKDNVNHIFYLFGADENTDPSYVMGKYNRLLSEIVVLINSATDDIMKNEYLMKQQEYANYKQEIINDRDMFNENLWEYVVALDSFMTFIDSMFIENAYLSEDNYISLTVNKVNFNRDILDVSKIASQMINAISKHLEYSNKSLLELETETLKSAINISKVVMEDIFVDSYLTDSEKIIMTQQLQNIETDKVNLEESYQALMSNKYIVDENKNDLIKAYDYFCQQYLNLIDVVNSFLTKTSMMTPSDNVTFKQAMSDYNSAMGKFSNAKDKAISEAYKNEAEKYSEKSIESNMIQLSNSFSFTFDNVERKVTSENDRLIETLTKFQTYIRLIQGDDNKPHIVLGKTGNTTDSKFKVDISNEKISFLQNDIEVAYVQYDEFKIANGEVLDSLRIGAFAFQPNDDGGVTFKYKGVRS